MRAMLKHMLLPLARRAYFVCRPTLTKAKNELTTTATQNVNGQQPASSGVETGSMQATANRQR